MKHSCRYTTNASIRRISGKISKVKAFTERRERESRVPFPSLKVFDLVWPFHTVIRDGRERRFLLGRMRAYAYGSRRGRLCLPSRFSSLVRETADMTKSHIRYLLSRVKPDLAADCAALSGTFDYANRVLTRCMWRFTGDISRDCARQVDCHRLGKSCVPRVAGSSWPSSPSVTELMMMSKLGKVPLGLWKPRKVVNDHPTVRDLSLDSHLATRVIADNVIGIRSTVSVPRQFLPWFRYRDGLLVLTVRYHLPIGLVRLLLSTWIQAPHSLWLRAKCRLKYYLRLVPRGSSCRPCGAGLPAAVRCEGVEAKPTPNIPETVIQSRKLGSLLATSPAGWSPGPIAPS